MSLRSVSSTLKKQHIIRSRAVFEAFMIIFEGEKHVFSADYLFEDREPVYKVARRISKGERYLASVKVTIPEGFNVYDIADLFDAKLANFNKEKFLLNAEDREGYLFPDTYFFFATDTEVDVLSSMSENFNKKIEAIRPQIIASSKVTGRTEEDLIIMASLIEGEAKGELDRELISGILWKRLGLSMPLQVDAAQETYKVKGLPESPIGNPGLLAIRAALYPQNSPYLYYLHDKDGNIHYAKNFAEHRRNVDKYLK